MSINIHLRTVRKKELASMLQEVMEFMGTAGNKYVDVDLAIKFVVEKKKKKCTT